MQANISLGLVEFSSIAKGIEALDAMCKAAGVKPEVHQAISKGKYIIVISGPVGEVESALGKGAEIAGDPQALASALHDGAKECGLEMPRLIVEPGRAIVARSGVALYRVGVIKDIPGVRCYVSVDGGMGDNIRQPMYGARQEALVANRVTARDTRNVTISGKYCESGDILIKEISLPELKAGDVLAMAGSGAYCIPMQSNYNASFRPAVVFVNDGKARLVRRRETLEDLIRCDLD